MMTDRTWHLASRPGPGMLLDITPESVGWRHLSSSVVALAAGETLEADTGGNEVAIIPLAGAAEFGFGGATYAVSRRDVFTEKPQVAYLPPRTAYTIRATSAFEFASGGLPAEGRYPARLFTPDEVPGALRGGANVSRGVTGALDMSLPAERLIAYEIVTPSGNWSSFPPHRHDGTNGTTNHEETYYFRLQPRDGFALQRIYSPESDLDLSFRANDGDLILVHEGYHTVATAPGTNAYYLNFLGGDVRPVTMFFDPAFSWVAEDWEGKPVAIPVGGQPPEA
jgi:5-deoxy-glucuronate isomerase